jgi:conserved domain protein
LVMQSRRMKMEFRERKRWVFFGLPFTFTIYTVKEEVLTVDTGFLSKEENDCYMYKVQDVTLKTSLLERIFGLGTIICYTGDTTNPQLVMAHIKNARAIKDFILEQSEIARRKRRTMNTLDIGADGSDFDIDN